MPLDASEIMRHAAGWEQHRADRCDATRQPSGQSPVSGAAGGYAGGYGVVGAL